MPHRVTGNLHNGLLFVLSAPAGTGKTTLVSTLLKRTESVVKSVSYTTRSPRIGEIQGEHYHFVDDATFQKKIEAGDFLEHVELYGRRYGTSRFLVEEQRARGKHVILIIDTQGALRLLKEGEEAIFIFIAPPSFSSLEERLKKRQTESAEAIDIRLAWAESELAAIPHYDYLIVNDDLAIACEVLHCIIAAEEHRTIRLSETKSALPHIKRTN